MRHREVGTGTRAGTAAVLCLGIGLAHPAAQERFQPSPPIAGCPSASRDFLPCARPKAERFEPPRLSDGTPDMQGAWIARTANGTQNIEDYPGDTFLSPQITLIVDPADGKVPYLPQYAGQKDRNFTEYIDPWGTCFISGVPRQVYSARGLHILQSPGVFAFVNEYAHTYRVVPTDGSPHIHDQLRLLGGDSRGRWEGKTLVVETKNLTGKTWLDIRGSFHSDALTVRERFTLLDRDTILYEATLTDPKVYSRPFTMAMPLVRLEPGHEVMEEACYEGDQDLPGMLRAGYKIYFGQPEQ